MTSSRAHHAGPIQAFRVRASALEPHAEASHTEHVFSYLAAGELQMHHGSPVTLQAGTVTLVPAGVPHRLVKGSDVDLWIVSFCAGCLSLDEHQPLMAPFYRARLGALPVLQIPVDRRERLTRRFAELEDELLRSDPTTPVLSRSLLNLLLGELGRVAATRDVQPPAGSLVGDALAFIQSRCLEPISLRDVAGAVHRSPAHVATQVKRATGYTVGEWITAGRVAEAAARLSHTDDRIAEIAEHVGWTDTTHFIRQFKKAFGQTPAAWRRARRSREAPASGTL